MRGAKKRKKSPAGEGRRLSPGTLKALSLALVVALAGSALWYEARKNNFFPLKQIVITGNKNLSSRRIISVLGVKTGANMLDLSKKQLAWTLSQEPWVKRVSLRNEVLNGRLYIKVKEREPFVLIQRDGGVWIADVQGRLLEELAPGASKILPVIYADVKNYRETFKEAILFARRLKDKGYFSQPIAINASCPPEDLSMELNGMDVKVGYGNYRRKLDKLEELQSEVERRGIHASSMDLRFANRVIVSPVAEVAK